MSVAKVAQLAGVSTATVSRVINAHPSVSPRAVQAVNEVIERISYQPRKSGRRQSKRPRDAKRRRRKLAALALIMPDLQASFFPSLVSSFETTAREFGQQVLICNSENSVANQADIIVQLIENRVAGVALMPPSTSDTPATHHVRLLQRCGIPVLLLHREIEGAVAPLVALPYEDVGRRAALELLELGHRRVAVFLPQDTRFTRANEKGFRDILIERDVALPDEWVHIGSVRDVGRHEAAIEAALSRLIALPTNRRPTAIFAAWEDDAQLLCLNLLNRGIRIPEDISIITTGSTWRSDPIRRRLSAITFDEIESGRTAAQFLMSMANCEKPITFRDRRVLAIDYYTGLTLGSPAQGE